MSMPSSSATYLEMATYSSAVTSLVRGISILTLGASGTWPCVEYRQERYFILAL